MPPTWGGKSVILAGTDPEQNMCQQKVIRLIWYLMNSCGGGQGNAESGLETGSKSFSHLAWTNWDDCSGRGFVTSGRVKYMSLSSLRRYESQR